uniref:NB-ARC domain-containing protein n=1 Tax=Leersia perrieri TaxID=77586 RepID=A0A0D9W1U7_9ORYZ
MPTDRWTEIYGGSIDAVAARIIDLLEEDTSRETRSVMYFDGWYGMWASAILKVVAKRLRSSPEKLRLDKIIHVDCSLWQSKRALQKAIAQELDLPLSVMAMFDQHDEEDDFNGIEQGAREVIPDVTRKIMTDLLNTRFIVIFHDGSDDGHIDLLQECGVPSKMGFWSKTLWTSQGRFQSWAGEDLKKTARGRLSVVAVFPTDISELVLLHENAKEAATYTGIPEPGMSPKIVKECIMYYKLLSLEGGNHGIDWATHAANYWLQVTTDAITEDQHHSQVLAAALFPDLSSSGILKTIILDGCVELEEIGPDNLPPLLESCSFSSNNNDNVDVSSTIESISFRGCTQLKSVLLRGLFQKLTKLDMSGTCIKILDLRPMRGIWSLKQLFLLGCVKLHAILWPTNAESLEVLHIDTCSSNISHAAGVAESSANLKWYISLLDERLLGSLNNIESPYSGHVEVSSPASVATAAADCCESGRIIIKTIRRSVDNKQPWFMTTKSWQQQPAVASYYRLYADVGLEVQHLELQATISNYIGLQEDQRMRRRPLRAPHLPVSQDKSYEARRWLHLRWCRVERCPNIEDVVFTPPSIGRRSIFWYLKTFWASGTGWARNDVLSLTVFHLKTCKSYTWTAAPA